MSTDDLIAEFAKIREKRWGGISQLVTQTENVDELLADIANLATALYLLRKSVPQKMGFQSYERKGKTGT